MSSQAEERIKKNFSDHADPATLLSCLGENEVRDVLIGDYMEGKISKQDLDNILAFHDFDPYED